MTDEPSRDQLIAANEDAAQFYRRHLLGPDGDGPRRYLSGRGFAALLEDTAWTVGHAPAAWTALHDHLSELGYSDEAQLAAGLTSRSRRGHLIDRFRDRITFGVRDGQDELVGFTARTGPNGRDPKYLNTSKTTLFDKSQVLFGLGEASRSPAASYVLVEGPLDAIAFKLADPSGVAALALCGTALTAKHAEIIGASEYDRLVLAFDDDSAGARALETAAVALSDDRTVATAPRTGRRDPASILSSEGPQALLGSLSSARPAAEVLLELHLRRWPDRLENAEAAIACLRDAASMIARVKPPDVAALARRLSYEIKMSTSTVTTELTNAIARQAQQSRSDGLSHEPVASGQYGSYRTRSAPATQR